MLRALAPMSISLSLVTSISAASAAAPCVGALTDRCHSWAATYDGPGGEGDLAEVAAISPDGRTLFVGGGRTVRSAPLSEDSDFGIVAYEAATGRQLWTGGYNGPDGPDGASHDGLRDLVTDGERVYATGYIRASGGEADFDYATIAWDASTGERSWVRRVSGERGAWDQSEDLVLGSWTEPDGRRRKAVFVGGWSRPESGFASRSIAVAYDAATGRELWRTEVEGFEWRTIAYTERRLPDRGTEGLVHLSGMGMSTVTLDASSGEERWREVLDVGGDGGGYSWSSDAAGGRVFVTGFTFFLDLNVGSSRMEITTLARDAATGALLWKKTYDDPDGDPFAQRLATDGEGVYVTGYAPTGKPLTSEALTIAYDARTGAQRWVGLDAGIADDGLTGWDVLPGGDGLVFTAAYSPFTVIARDVQTGARRWTGRYTPPGPTDGAHGLAVAPDGSRVYATGVGSPTSLVTGSDFLTVAWDL